MRLSIVIPCHNEEACLPFALEALEDVVAGEEFQCLCREVEVILVDDGSSDGTLGIMRSVTRDRRRRPFCIRYLSFSRNFGKEAGLLAGLRAAEGELVAVMDCDLQDPPALLTEMLRILHDDPDTDCVATRRITRTGEPWLRSLGARIFYRLVNAISPTPVPDGARDFRMMRRPVVDSVLSLGETCRFSKGIFGWVGFNTRWIDYENTERAAGTTSWSFWGLARYAFEGIIAVSTVPLAIASYAGIALCAVAFVAVVVIVVRAALFGDPVAGWPSLACIITFIGGLQLLCLGVIGQYLAKTYLETKRRPVYIVREEGGCPLGAGGSGDAAPAASEATD